eukprot:scaffold16785_cov84-Cylindrotheca_fusiformis.AAC.2
MTDGSRAITCSSSPRGIAEFRPVMVTDGGDRHQYPVMLGRASTVRPSIRSSLLTLLSPPQIRLQRLQRVDRVAGTANETLSRTSTTIPTRILMPINF